MPHTVTEMVVDTATRYLPARGPGFVAEMVREGLAAKKFAPEQISLRELAEGCFGRHSYEGRLQRVSAGAEWVKDSTEAVDLTVFRGVIQGNVGAVMERAYGAADSVTDQLFGSDPDEAGMDPMQTRKNPIDAVATDPPRDVAPGTDYPRTSFSPYYIETPIPDKYGLIAVLTLELVKANATRRYLKAAEEVGRKVRVEQRKRRLRVVLGITNNYKRNGTSYNTFLTSGDRVNKLTDFVTANGPAEFDRLAQLFDSMTDPFTGEPMEDMEPNTILTVRGNLFGVRETLNAQLLRLTVGATQIETPPPFDFGGEVVTDRYVFNMLVNERGLTAAQAATYVQIGDHQRAFKVREVEPFHTFEVGPNDEAWPPHFFQDVVYATKARIWEAAYAADPFAVAEAYNASAT